MSGASVIPPGVVSLTELVPVPDGVPDVTVVPESTTNDIAVYGPHSTRAIL